MGHAKNLPAVQLMAFARIPDRVDDDAGRDGGEVADEPAHNEGRRASVAVQATETEDEVFGQPDEENRGKSGSEDIGVESP